VGVLDRVNARAARGRGDEARFGIDDWISQYLIPSAGQFNFTGVTYPFGGITGLNQTLAGGRAAEIANSLPGYRAAMQQCPPAFGAEMVRALILSQARFTWRNPPWHPRTPRRLFSNSEMAVLEKPWPNGTTGDLVSRMEWHAGLAGNAFVLRQARRLRTLRPDWTAIIFGSESEPEWPSGALDAELLGYVYCNRGIGNGKPSLLLPADVAHWAPLPDPEMTGLGMSWLTPAIREMQVDRLATEHQVKFFENGAAQPYNAGMLTPAGWARMEDISAGDLVTGPDGKPRRVLGVYPQGEKGIYRLTFASGATVECCEDHLWTVATTHDRKHGTSRTMRLRELLDAGIRYPSGAAKWAIPLADPVEYASPAPLPLHPYLTGMLLGDGSFRGNGKGSGGVTLAAHTPDADETEALIRPLLPEGVTISRRDRAGKAGNRHTELYFRGHGGPSVNPLTRIVRDLGLFDVHGRDKAVPDIYMRGLIADRIAVLQGLIDSDGHVNRAVGASTGATFTSTSETLARQVQELVRGLGGVASCNEAAARPNEPGRRPQWRVYLNRLPEWIIPARLSRKRASYRPSGRSGRYQYLMQVEPAGRRPAQCIKVDAEDGLYVTDDFIVTHNTPNLVVKGIPAMDRTKFDELVAAMEEGHAGVANAYRTLYLVAGADASVVGSNLADLDLKGVQGSRETRLSVLSRVPAVILGISEGLQGSSLNAGNFSAARRLLADSWVFPSLQGLAGALASILTVPSDAELWFDGRDMPILREDAKDAADISRVQAETIATLAKEGFTPDSSVAAVLGQDMSLLRHSGLVSVQLWEPGGESPRKPRPGAESPSQPTGAGSPSLQGAKAPASGKPAAIGGSNGSGN